MQLARVLCQVWAPVLDGKPRYLFLDEPVSSLDIKHQLIIMNLARDFAQRGGGVVAILHDLNLTAMYADRIFVMHRGRLAAAGSPQEVLSDELISRVFECKPEGRRPACRQGALSCCRSRQGSEQFRKSGTGFPPGATMNWIQLIQCAKARGWAWAARSRAGRAYQAAPTPGRRWNGASALRRTR